VIGVSCVFRDLQGRAHLPSTTVGETERLGWEL
jgi:hypothetical protein